MNINLQGLIDNNDVIAVALSGGSDSMALLHVLLENSKKYNYKVIALNVEHGIRGEESISDTQFAVKYCDEHGIKLLTYTVDSVKKAREEKLSIEQAARLLRYECFYDAINKGLCNKVATAHHQSDNAESVLINIFRGTGLKGITGIEKNYNNQIIRPLLNVSKAEIEEYIRLNNLPFVTDSTNLSDEYTRNFLRLNIIPKLKEIFPDVEKSIIRLSEIATNDNDYLDTVATNAVEIIDDKAQIKIPSHPAIFGRAMIKAIKALGIEKDWTKTHITDVYALSEKQTGNMINLPQNVVAIREYDKIVFYKDATKEDYNVAFNVGSFSFNNKTITCKKCLPQGIDLKDGLYADYAKISESAVIRFRKDGDVFTKFGGGTKKVNDYFTDKKIPLKDRDTIPLLADEKEVLVIFGVGVSDKIKVDENTKEIIKFDIQKGKKLWKTSKFYSQQNKFKTV